MAYHPLTSDTAQTPERRREEADRILILIYPEKHRMENRELNFVEDIAKPGPVSPKQILWLRDLKAKYVD